MPTPTGGHCWRPRRRGRKSYSASERAHRVRRKIVTTSRIQSKHDIPDDTYRKMVLTLMDKQASREVATAEVFGQCVLHAPTIEDKIRITRFQHEELKHFQLLARIMTELGVDMDVYVQDRQRAG